MSGEQNLVRKAVVADDHVVNVIMAPAEVSVDPWGRELVAAPHGSGIEIGAVRQNDVWVLPGDD